MKSIACGTICDVICSHAQIEGTIHSQDQHICEDAVFRHFTDSYLFYGLADGQSGTAYGLEGGMACLEAISDYINSVGIKKIIDIPFPDELPCQFVQIFRKKLISLAHDKNTELKEFASTFLAIVIDLNSGKYMLLHLGDGCAVSVPHTGDPMVISAPDNGLASCHTWLTTSENAVPHFHVTFGSLEVKKRILLLSDGATCFCRGRSIPWRVKELMKNGSQFQLHDGLMQSNPVDDATCIILDFCK